MKQTEMKQTLQADTDLDAALAQMAEEAPPMPAKNVKGTDKTNAQGQDITRNVNARSSHIAEGIVVNIGGIIAIIIAKNTTIGVYIFANFVMKFSVFAFLSEEVSISSRIF